MSDQSHFSSDFEQIQKVKGFLKQGNYDEARNLLNNLLELIQKKGPESYDPGQYEILIGYVFKYIGDTYFSQDSFVEASSYYLQAVTYFESLDNPPLGTMITVYESLAVCFEKLGSDAEASKYRGQASKLKREQYEKEIEQLLTAANYKIEKNVSKILDAPSIDIFAQKKISLFKKHKICIWFATDEATAETMQFIVNDYRGFGDIVVVLLSGDPTIVIGLPKYINVVASPKSFEKFLK